jgi:hypothetical protein
MWSMQKPSPTALLLATSLTVMSITQAILVTLALEVGDDVSATAQIDNRVESTAGLLAADTYTQSIGWCPWWCDVANYSITLDTANNYVVDAKAITYSIAAGNITYGNVDSAGDISYTGSRRR